MSDLLKLIKKTADPKVILPLYTYELRIELGQKFMTIANGLVEASTRGQKSLHLTPEMELVYKKVMSHTNSSEDSELDIFNGIGFIGKFGTGKTILMQTIRMFFQQFSLRNQDRKIVSKFFTAFEIVEIYRMDNLNRTNDFKQLCDRLDLTIFIDELGDEPRKSMSYGNEESVMYRFLKIKLDQIESGADFKLYFTSNLSAQEIEDVYGERLYSRLTAYVNVIFLDSENFKDLRNE